jgi:hypothetical protein
LVADECAADGEEGFVDVVSAVVATVQATVAVEPGDRALDHPAIFAEPRAVSALAFGYPGGDAALAECRAVATAVIRTVGEQAAMAAE